MIQKHTIRIEEEALQEVGMRYNKISICELGNQLTFKKETGKKYYQNKGVKKHISIDLNSKDGALPLDLDFPLPFSLLKGFDLVTDYGTIEHVNNQFQVFKNVHDICKKQGLMIHIIPSIGSAKGHGRYYYSEEFMNELGKACGYKIIKVDRYTEDQSEKVPNPLILGIFLKEKDNEFISENVFNKLKGLEDSGDLRNTGNYEATIRYKARRWKGAFIRSIMHPGEVYNKIKERLNLSK